MNTKPAFLIPNFRHARMLPDTIAGLRKFNVPIVIIDDGSGESDRPTLERLSAEDGIHVEYLAENGGKGHAVKAGLRYLHQAGFSHAFQIDADGQHDQSVIPAFLAKSAAQPDALICGQPEYDDSAPKSRLYGRRITNFWVAIETWSRSIKDAMCGFRVYPLAATAPVLRQNRLGNRMDFDIEILVRLFWAGVPLVWHPIRVDYPADGVSHFKGLRDNALISWMHTRLFFGMLWRWPRFLFRRAQKNKIHWAAHQERGSLLGIQILFGLYRLFGRKVFKACLYPVMAYYVLFNRAGREASLDFLSRIGALGHNEVPVNPGKRQVFRHFLEFGEAVLDKISAWRGEFGYKDIHFQTDLKVWDVVRQGKGALLIGSHLGNLELVRALATLTDYTKITGVFFTEHSQKFSEYLKQQNPEVAERMIEVSSLGMDTAMLLQQRIAEGELLVIVGDRTPVHSDGRVEWVDFLGAPAPFPQGPFILASLLQCPVYLFFCLRERGQANVYLEPFAEKIAGDRRQRKTAITAAINAYAQRLAFYARKAPYQWFNFFPFWPQAISQQDAVASINQVEQTHE